MKTLIALILTLPLASLGATKLSKEELKKKLTPEQYHITQEEGTEQPFKNAYHNNHEDGIYVDLVTGEAIFSSLDKYDSGTGWPSFTKPIDEKRVTYKKDTSLFGERNEVRSTSSDSHLGHVFDDGPKDKGGKRYCMNSGALKFIPKNKMKEAGYGQYLFDFAKSTHWETAEIAGGCFWGMENVLRGQKGIMETRTGYEGGKKSNPVYEEVSAGDTGYAESVQILFDPKVVSYEDLLLLFFKTHNPTTLNRQGNDTGTQYRSAIFYENEAQKAVAEKVKARVEASHAWKKPLVTEISAGSKFWPAEEHHQKYLVKNPRGYNDHEVHDVKF
ncbi:MAG: bifunctional methionine sulfoxide reductase B/A protein [Bdellovibrionales bacterium]|nr:bifunctional methionine sulfoxide reductase B/A protein [Oligoflexia bacterium]